MLVFLSPTIYNSSKISDRTNLLPRGKQVVNDRTPIIAVHDFWRGSSGSSAAAAVSWLCRHEKRGCLNSQQVEQQCTGGGVGSISERRSGVLLLLLTPSREPTMPSSLPHMMPSPAAMIPAEGPHRAEISPSTSGYIYKQRYR